MDVCYLRLLVEDTSSYFEGIFQCRRYQKDRRHLLRAFVWSSLFAYCLLLPADLSFLHFHHQHPWVPHDVPLLFWVALSCCLGGEPTDFVLVRLGLCYPFPLLLHGFLSRRELLLTVQLRLTFDPLHELVRFLLRQGVLSREDLIGHRGHCFEVLLVG